MISLFKRLDTRRDRKENGDKADGKDQGKGVEMGKIYVIDTEKHDLFYFCS